MTASEIVNIAVTVATIQIICDLIANWQVFNGEPYQRAVSALGRATAKLEREKAAVEKDQSAVTVAPSTKKGSASKADKLAKRLQRAEDEHSEALGNVARKHTTPSIFTSILFVILMRILGTEHNGKVMGVLPFVPYSFLRRITARGLEFDTPEFDSSSSDVAHVGQACSYLFIYFLCAFSVKFYAGKLFGKKPPKGAEGFMAAMHSPQGQNLIRSMGMDPAEFKNA